MLGVAALGDSRSTGPAGLGLLEPLGRPFGVSIPVTVGPRSYRDPMRLLHTSDWHLGRSFHGQSLLADQETVLCALADLASERDVDVILQ